MDEMSGMPPEVGCTRETVRGYLAAGRWRKCQVPVRPNMLTGHADWIADRFRRHRGNADVVRQKLASELGAWWPACGRWRCWPCCTGLALNRLTRGHG